MNDQRRQAAIEAVRDERARQDAKWGEQNCHDFEWVSILTEEVGEAARAANEANFTSGKNRGEWADLRAELVQVAAVAVAWIEAIDRRGAAVVDAALPHLALGYIRLEPGAHAVVTTTGGEVRLPIPGTYALVPAEDDE